MSFLDKARDRAQELAEAAKRSAGEHSDQIGKAVTKAGALADKATQGRYTGHIANATGKARDAVDNLDDGPGDPTGPPGS